MGTYYIKIFIKSTTYLHKRLDWKKKIFHKNVNLITPVSSIPQCSTYWKYGTH